MQIPSWIWLIWRVLRLVIIAYVALTVLLLLFERRFIYHPSNQPVVPWDSPGIPVEDCWMQTADGNQVHGWWMGQENEEAPVVLFFHGNGGNLSHRVELLRLLHNRGFRILAIDYRGYGRSEGSPTEMGLYTDAEAAYDYLINRKDVSPGRIIAYGKSLGTAVALKLALSVPVGGVIMESPLASARAMAAEMVPIVPVGPFVRAEFNNVEWVTQLTRPLLVIHGDEDEIVPFEQGRAVYEAASGATEFFRVEGAGHNNVYRVGEERYLDKIATFCHAVTRQSTSGQ